MVNMDKKDFITPQSNRDIFTKIDRLDKLNNAQKNLYNANEQARDVNEELAENREQFEHTKANIKLMNNDLILSKELMKKIKKRGLKSKYLFYASIGFPFIAFALGFILKLIIFYRNIR